MQDAGLIVEPVFTFDSLYESADLTTKRIVTLQEILYAGGIQGSGIYQEPKMFHRFITGSMSEN
jgi:hypothetical protein